MNIEEKNKIVMQYLYETFLELKQLCQKDKGFFITEDKYKKALNMFLNRSEDITTLKGLIDIEKQNLLDSYLKWEEQERQLYLEQFQKKSEENERLGITLNRQIIELMMIANSTSIDELKKVSNELYIDISDFSLDLNQMKEYIFDKYMSDLTDRNEWYKNPALPLNQVISNIINNSNLTSVQIEKLKTVIQNGMESGISTNEIIKNIDSQFSKEISHNIFVALSESRDLSQPGINNLQIPDCQLLYDKLRDFKSITIDFEVKYPALHMVNGELYFRKLERCLNFARNLGKEVRLNALIFFEDCPEDLKKLEYNEFNKQKVYNELLKYVDTTTKMIASYNQISLRDYGYEVIKSIDIFNELITRFADDFNNKYLIRENISKDNSQESGWQKFLNIEDLCEIALIARKNLPNVEFVYNEINLEDKNKLPLFESVLDRIKNFEEKNKDVLKGKKLIDCIGTQMHLNPYVTEKELDYSLSTICSYGYPIKITEYDQPLSDEYIKHHSKKECEEEKQRIQDNLKFFIMNNASKYNLKQVTIWSITDSTNFLLDKKNSLLIKQGRKPIKSIYGGAFRDKKVFDYRTSDEIQLGNSIKEKNMAIKQQKEQKRSLDKPKVKTLTKLPNNGNSSSSSGGFVDTLVITLITGFIAGVLFMLVYSLIK